MFSEDCQPKPCMPGWESRAEGAGVGAIAASVLHTPLAKMPRMAPKAQAFSSPSRWPGPPLTDHPHRVGEPGWQRNVAQPNVLGPWLLQEGAGGRRKESGSEPSCNRPSPTHCGWGARPRSLYQ